MALVLLFLPFSVLAKLLNFSGAERQAAEFSPTLAPALIVAGVLVEVVMPLGILSGFADRLAALVMGGYRVVTALLWKQFWKPGDFWSGGKGRGLFWDFLKNVALGASFLLITFGNGPIDLAGFLSHPLASTQPYGSVSVPR